MKKARTTQWSNPSVLAFSGGEEPIEVMEARARKLVLSAMESGWNGPPFDPIKLAEMLGIRVSASGDVPDARTIALGKNKFCIEYNPSRPRGRIRFSIAHEIAHTFFADCGERIRHREKVGGDSDFWQLETLCNIGAAELVMPIGSSSQLEKAATSLGELLELRRSFDVSTEAMLIRLAKLTRKPLVVFVASRTKESTKSARFRFDYAISSVTWPFGDISGRIFESEIANECTAIGYQVSGMQSLPVSGGKFLMECVGLAPYPGNNHPRVAGIISASRAIEGENSAIHYHEGDATCPGGSGKKIIAHIVNDKTSNWGGGGFAVSLKKRYPDVQRDFKSWASSFDENLMLGRSHFHELADDLYAFSMVAQHGYGRSSSPRIRYNALEICLDNLQHRAKNLHASVHMPRIGVGNAGGDWSVIKELIQEKLVNEHVAVHVYDFLRK